MSDQVDPSRYFNDCISPSCVIPTAVFVPSFQWVGIGISQYLFLHIMSSHIPCGHIYYSVEYIFRMNSEQEKICLY